MWRFSFFLAIWKTEKSVCPETFSSPPKCSKYQLEKQKKKWEPCSKVMLCLFLRVCTHQLSRVHTGLDCGRNSTKFFCWTDSSYLLGECHKHMTVPVMCGIGWLIFIPSHAAKYPLLLISEESVFLPYHLTLSRTLNCYLSQKYFIQKANSMEDSRHTLFRTTFFWWLEDLLRKSEI